MGLLRSCSSVLGRGSVVLPNLPNGHMNGGSDHDLSHSLTGGCLVVACGIQLYFYVSYILANFHSDAGSLECASAHRAAFMIVLFRNSAVPLICGCCGMVVFCDVPCCDMNIPTLV